MENQRNEFLWRKAQNRAAFKTHLMAYAVVILFLWAIYFFTMVTMDGRRIHPWPIWPTLGWGIGLSMHYFSAYGSTTRQNRVQKEYDKLLEEEGR